MENFKKLLKVKSIITILLTLVVCYLALFKNYDIKEIYLMIIAFYFGTQTEKNNKQEGDKMEDLKIQEVFNDDVISDLIDDLNLLENISEVEKEGEDNGNQNNETTE